MTPRTDLLRCFERYCAEAQLSESSFGRAAVRDGKFVANLRTGTGVTLTTIEKALAYVEANPPTPAASSSRTENAA